MTGTVPSPEGKNASDCIEEEASDICAYRDVVLVTAGISLRRRCDLRHGVC